jgi:hypothetical protein
MGAKSSIWVSSWVEEKCVQKVCQVLEGRGRELFIKEAKACLKAQMASNARWK